MIESHAHISGRKFDGTFRYLTCAGPGVFSSDEGDRAKLIGEMKSNKYDRIVLRRRQLPRLPICSRCGGERMLISTKARYVSRMLADIAMHQEDGRYVPMKDVAARQRISKKYLEALTAPLASAGILGIRRGKGGGYRLLMPPGEITLWRIVCLTDGTPHAVACLEGSVNTCARCGFCVTLPAWEGLEKAVRDYLSSVTLRQLIDRAKPQPDNAEDYPCGV